MEFTVKNTSNIVISKSTLTNIHPYVFMPVVKMPCTPLDLPFNSFTIVDTQQ